MITNTGLADPTGVARLRGRFSAMGLAKDIMDSSGLQNLHYYGTENVGEVVQQDSTGRPSKRMFALRTQCEKDYTLVHIRDRDYLASKDLAKKQQVH